MFKKICTVALLLLLVIQAIPVFAAPAPVWYGLERNLTVYGKMESNGTGPAAIKSILGYLTGLEFRQDEISSKIGLTDKGAYLTDMLDYVNKTQNSSKLKSYNGKDFSTMTNSLYDTVVNRNTPAVIGVNTLKSEGWPYSTGKNMYVTVYGVRSDLKEFKIADHSVLEEEPKDLQPLYTVSAEALFAAYARCNAGLSYGVDSLTEVKPAAGTNSPENKDSVHLKVEKDSYAPADELLIKYTVNNPTKSAIMFGYNLGLQKYDSASKSWKDMEWPSLFPVPMIALHAAPGSSEKFEMNLPFKGLTGEFRLVQPYGQGDNSLSAYSTAFKVGAADGVTLKVEKDSYAPADELLIKYTVNNPGKSVISFGYNLGLQKYDTASKSWKDMEWPSPFPVPRIALNVGPGASEEFEMNLPFKGLTGEFRLVQPYGQDKDSLTAYSTSFKLGAGEGVNLKVEKDAYVTADELLIKYSVNNPTKSAIMFGYNLGLQKYDSATKTWKDMEWPSLFPVPMIALHAAPGTSENFEMNLPFKGLTGEFRLVQPYAQGDNSLSAYSTVFKLTAR